MEKVYDYIVAGSGFGGSVASLRLSEKGYSVLTIEKGKRFESEDFPKSNWNLRKYLWLPIFGFFGIQKITFNRKASILSGVGVGGGSLVYANTLFYPPDDFFEHTAWKKYADWKQLLNPYYKTAAFMMGRTLRMILFSLRNPLKFLKVIFNLDWSTNLVIFLVMQHIENYMRMIWKPGLFGGRIVLDNSGQKRVPAYIDIGQQVMEAYAKKTNGIAQNIILELMFDRPTTAHILGGCPMSENISNGVVNPDLSVHGYPGLHIVDGSVIQGNIGVNPSFTILAMAEYAMSKIPDKVDK